MVKNKHMRAKQKTKRLKVASFSRLQLVVFAIAFAVIGYVIFKSFAAGSLGPTFATFESGNLSEFADSTCHPEKVSILTSGAREGSKYARFSADQNTHCYGDNANVRVHMIAFPSSAPFNINDGSTFWWTISMRVPSANQFSSWYAGAEIHQDSSTAPYSCPGPAPFYIGVVNNQWQIVSRGATASQCPNSQFTQHAFGAPATSDGSTWFSQPFDNGISPSIQRDQWYDFLIGLHMSWNNTGWIEAWMNGPQTSGQSKQIINRVSIPTDFEGKTNAPMLNVYYPTQSGNFYIDYDGGRFSTDFSLLKDWQNTFTNSWGSGSTSPPPPPPPSSPPPSTGGPTDCTNGCTVTDGMPVTITGPTRLLSDNSNEIITQSDGTGHRLYPTAQVSDATIRSFDQQTVTVVGTAVGSNSNFPINVSSIVQTGSSQAPPQYIGSNISAGQTINTPYTWTVDASGSVASVEFWANNQKLATDTTAPYSYELIPGALADGSNALGLAVVGVDGSRQTPQVGQVTINNSSSAKLGDINSDGRVDVSDMSILLSHFNASATAAQGDLNGDGKVTILDLSILLSKYGS